MRFDSVLFVCVANAARSQLAEALARHRFGGAVRVQSAGSAPAALHPLATAALAEHGLSTEGQHAKGLDSIDLDEVDLIVTLCAEAACPVLPPGVARLDWPLADPAAAAPGEDAGARMARFRQARAAIDARIAVLAALRDGPPPLAPTEFHASIRVPDLPAAARFYAWLLGVAPKTWTHRYVTFVSPALRTNLVLLVDDGLELHHDTLYHVGVELPDRAAVVAAHHAAAAAGLPIHKPARTTWRGTPLHELWLRDPGGNLVEVYARLRPAERAEMPADQQPTLLVAG